MRLKEIKQKIIENQNFLKLKNTGTNGNNLIVNGFTNSKQALLNLKEIPGLQKLVNEILASNVILQSHTDQVIIDSQLGNNLINSINRLREESIIISNLISELYPEQRDLTFSIKFQPLDKFGDFSETIHTLEKIILRPISILGEEVIIGELEHGSRWMELVFTSVISYYCFAGVVEKAFDIFIDKYQKKNALDLVIKTFNHSEETINLLRKSEENRFKEICSLATDELIKELKSNEKLSAKSKEINELCDKSRNTLQFAIEKQEELIEKGLEVYQTIENGDQEHRKIPDFSQKEALITSRKMISNE